MKTKQTLFLLLISITLLANTIGCNQLTAETTPFANTTQTPRKSGDPQPTPIATTTFIPTKDISIKEVSILSWNGVPIMSGAMEGELSDSSYSFYVDTSIDKAESYYLDEMKKEGWAFATRASFESYRIILYFYQDNKNANIDLTKSSFNGSDNMLSVSIKVSALPFYNNIRSEEIVSSKITLEGLFWLIWPGVDGGKPIGSYIELRQQDNHKLLFTENSSWFRFEDIPPGSYELWVFIGSEALWLSDCYDIGLPDENWEYRKIIDGNKIEVIDGLSFREVVYPDSNEKTGTNINGLYAVLDNLVFKSGTENSIFPAFTCESY
jgi:hypothetical protein